MSAQLRKPSCKSKLEAKSLPAPAGIRGPDFAKFVSGSVEQENHHVPRRLAGSLPPARWAEAALPHWATADVVLFVFPSRCLVSNTFVHANNAGMAILAQRGKHDGLTRGAANQCFC